MEARSHAKHRAVTGARRVAVVRALHGLGDMLCAVPALRALRAGFPNAELTLIGVPAARWFAERFGACVDAFMEFPGFPGIPEQPYSSEALCAFLARVHARPFDLAIQLHGSGTVSNAFTALLGARSTAGLYRPGQFRPSGATFFPYPEHGSEIHRWLRLTDRLHCPATGDALRFPVGPADRRELDAHATLRDLEPGRFACIHAGARDARRRWPAERFALVADTLARLGLSIVLTGTASERASAAAVARRMRYEPLNAAGATSLGALGALLERAVLLVTNDTGVSHLAAALGTPSVVIFLASDPERWAPLDRERHRVVVANGLVAEGCRGARTARETLPAPSEVLAEAFQALGATVAAHAG